MARGLDAAASWSLSRPVWLRGSGSGAGRGYAARSSFPRTSLAPLLLGHPEPAYVDEWKECRDQNRQHHEPGPRDLRSRRVGAEGNKSEHGDLGGDGRNDRGPRASDGVCDCHDTDDNRCRRDEDEEGQEDGRKGRTLARAANTLSLRGHRSNERLRFRVLRFRGLGFRRILRRTTPTGFAAIWRFGVVLHALKDRKSRQHGGNAAIARYRCGRVAGKSMPGEAQSAESAWQEGPRGRAPQLSARPHRQGCSHAGGTNPGSKPRLAGKSAAVGFTPVSTHLSRTVTAATCWSGLMKQCPTPTV